MRLRAYLWIVLFLSSCGGDRSSELATVHPVADDMGRTVSLPHVPGRIVSLSPHVTEILFALGLDSSIVGVTDYCDFPPSVRNIPRVGGLSNPNLEKLVELGPDVVIMTVSGNTRQDFESLERLNLAVFVTNPRNLSGVFDSIRRIGVLTGRAQAGDSLASLLRKRADSLTAFAATRRNIPTLFLLSIQPIISIGKETFLDELIRLAGGTNVSSGSSIAYPLLSKEEILQRAPEVIVVSSDVAASPDDVAHALRGLSTVPAVAHKRITIVEADLVSRPGPRIVDGLATIIKALHDTSGLRH